MIKFEYKTLWCNEDDLEESLNTYGRDGWQLHSCNALPMIGALGITVAKFNAVMQKATETQETQEKSSAEDDAISCRS